MKYHYYLEDMEFVKSLDVYDYYKIYIHWWIKRRMLNIQYPSFNLKLLEFKDFTYEMASDYYWRFKNEIKL